MDEPGDRDSPAPQQVPSPLPPRRGLSHGITPPNIVWQNRDQQEQVCPSPRRAAPIVHIEETQLINIEQTTSRTTDRQH